MEPEYVGFCRGCNCFSEHLKLRPVVNKNTGSMEVSMFCDSCREHFGLFPYNKCEMPDAKLKEGEKLKDGEQE